MTKRNAVVLSVVVVVLVMLGAAGWANRENRKHIAALEAERANEAVLMADQTTGQAAMVSPLVGKTATNFTLTDIHGKRVSLADYKGKAVQLNFWATWCAPCKIETPWLVELEKQYGPQGFEILGVSFDDLDKDDKAKLATETADIARSAGQLHISYPVLLDGDAIGKAYGDPSVFPTSYFIDRKGTIVASTEGLTSESDLENDIRKALGK